jgi:hypothetical protein
MRSRRLLIGVIVVGVAGALAGGYFTLHLLRPPALPPVTPADLEGFDPFTGIDKENILSARLAAGQVGQTRTVRMSVRDRRRDKDGTIFLFADRVPKDKPYKVFTVVIDPEAQRRFQTAGIADPYQHYWGTVIDVTGTIQCLQNDVRWRGIELKDPDKIEIAAK